MFYSPFIIWSQWGDGRMEVLACFSPGFFEWKNKTIERETGVKNFNGCSAGEGARWVAPRGGCLCASGASPCRQIGRRDINLSPVNQKADCEPLGRCPSKVEPLLTQLDVTWNKREHDDMKCLRLRWVLTDFQSAEGDSLIIKYRYSRKFDLFYARQKKY